VEPEVLAQLLETDPKPILLDVREDFERDISKLTGSVDIPLLDLEDHLDQLPVGKDVVVFCRNGIRSVTAGEVLRKAGYKNVYNLRGGINAWADRIDRNLVQY
jgi:adenylyltransferase/sulfurtransferase